MNRGIEFHDSEVRSTERLRDSVHIFFDPAYVHVSTGRPGIDAGEGHVQPAKLVFEAVVCEVIPPGCIGPISDGEVSINEVAYSLLPVPFHAEGAVVAE